MLTDTEGLVLNKHDMLPEFECDEERVCANYASVNPGAPLFRVSSRTGVGLDELAGYLAETVAGTVS